jgi:thiol-disulfide isomerase/thioredoxin
MREKRRHLLGALLAAPLVPLALPAAAAPRKGDRLPLADFPLLEGGKFDASEAKGRVVMVYWWASWCPFCREMTPGVEKLWRAHRERGLAVLGISIDRTVEAAAAYRRRFGYTFPSAIHGPEVERVLPKPRTVPTTWVRDRQGTLVFTATGQLFPEDVADIAKFL